MRTNTLKLLYCILLLFAVPKAFSQLAIIPQPVHLDVKNGQFIIDEDVSLSYPQGNIELEALSNYFSAYVRHISGIQIPNNKSAEKKIDFQLIQEDNIGEEGYKMVVSESNIQISANTSKGIFYGLQSLMQTLPVIRTNEELKVPSMEIEDYPQFAWRGMMLDVSRHFYSVDAIKEFIDLLALYKMNTFHWHLTDNEGWRLEIKKYPKLTSVGAWRKEIPRSIMYKSDSTYLEPLTGEAYSYGGFYTQEEAREVVAYALARNITVIPEIEMPGHSGAALSAYPEFSCFAHQQQTPNSTLWNGVVDPLKINLNYCAGNDHTFKFLQDVLVEVMDIFPSQYIHIGGDEVDKSYWKSCPKCQKRMKDESLKSEDELQSYFIHRMEDFLTLHNRKLLGWDEILEGGLAPSATVISWRGEKGGIAAAKAGHNVVMSPSDPLYFNRRQSNSDKEPFGPAFTVNALEKIYHYNPIPAVLTEKDSSFVLGAQFAIWTEFISSVEHLEYMLLPRMPAIAEALWTPSSKKEYSYFRKKLNEWHFTSWENKGIRFHRANFTERAHEGNR